MNKKRFFWGILIGAVVYAGLITGAMSNTFIVPFAELAVVVCSLGSVFTMIYTNFGMGRDGCVVHTYSHAVRAYANYYYEEGFPLVPFLGGFSIGVTLELAVIFVYVLFFG